MKKPPPHVSLDAFRADWVDGLMVVEMCQRHTLSKDQVVRLRVSIGLPPRMDRTKRRRSRPPVPTEQEIKDRAAAIRQGWDDETERRRRGGTADPYQIPLDVETPDDFDPAWYD